MSRTWVEMPAVSDDPKAAVRPKYPLDVNALVIYRGSKAYLAFEDQRARHAVVEHADVRLLTSDEGLRFEQSVSLPPLEKRQEPGRVSRLGDVVHRLTKRAGFTECAGCGRRRTQLNKVIVWGWWRTPRSQ
jgi:hypothetical protein